MPDASRARPVAAAHGALDRSGQAGVDPVAGEKQAADRRRRRRPRRLAGRERKRRARLADRPSRAAAAPPGRPASASSSSSCARRDQLVVGQRRRAAPRRSTPATGATRRRRSTSRLSNTHCIARPGRPTNGSSSTGDRTRDSPSRSATTPCAARAIEHRCERRRLAVEQIAQARTTARPRSRAPAVQLLAAGLDGRRRASPLDADLRRRRRSAPRRRALSMYCARRLGVHQVQRPGRQHDRRRLRIGAEHLGRARARTTGAAACCGGWFSAASASGSQSISRSRGVWPLRISQFSTVSPGDAAIAVRRPAQLRAARCRSGVGHAAAPTADRATTARPVEHAGQQMQRRRQRRTRRAATAVPARSIIVTASCGCMRT